MGKNQRPWAALLGNGDPATHKYRKENGPTGHKVRKTTGSRRKAWQYERPFEACCRRLKVRSVVGEGESPKTHMKGDRLRLKQTIDVITEGHTSMPVTGTGWSSVASHRQQPHVMLANDGEPALTGGNELTVAPALFEKLSNRYIQPASLSILREIYNHKFRRRVCQLPS